MDLALRELERRWQRSGAPRDHAALLGARLRLGLIEPAQLETAAFLGVPGARVALGRAPGFTCTGRCRPLVPGARDPALVQHAPRCEQDLDAWFERLALWPELHLRAWVALERPRVRAERAPCLHCGRTGQVMVPFRGQMSCQQCAGSGDTNEPRRRRLQLAEEALARAVAGAVEPVPWWTTIEDRDEETRAAIREALAAWSLAPGAFDAPDPAPDAPARPPTPRRPGGKKAPASKPPAEKAPARRAPGRRDEPAAKGAGPRPTARKAARRRRAPP